VIFSYVKRELVAVSVAKSRAYAAVRPAEFRRSPSWHSKGRRVDVSYQLVDPPVAIADILVDLLPLMPDKYSPLSPKGTGYQGYLFPLPGPAGRFLLDIVGATETPISINDPLDKALERTIPDKTTRKSLLESRIGQGRFRTDLVSVWGGRCAITGLDLVPILRASHIKPWRDSDNRERLDENNGLLLAPAYDSLFDAGLISFSDIGAIVISPKLTKAQLASLSVTETARLRFIRPEHRGYLDYHRVKKFSTH
jgi:putative restriction endonuclease